MTDVLEDAYDRQVCSIAQNSCRNDFVMVRMIAEIERLRRLTEWQPIETAPKGGGAELVTDPNWVEPPSILVLCDGGSIAVCHWDWYYADGGRGCTDGVAWVEPCSATPVIEFYGEPTHWMPLPPPPAQPERKYAA